MASKNHFIGVSSWRLSLEQTRWEKKWQLKLNKYIQPILHRDILLKYYFIAKVLLYVWFTNLLLERMIEFL